MRRLALLSLCGFFFVSFVGLGVWQLYRREWKLDLIQAVDQRVHAIPQPSPGIDVWSVLTPKHDQYRHVSATGHYLSANDTRVQAVTEFGGGFWVLTPFADDRGFTILINRGFIPSDSADPAPPTAHTSITGLLRFSEPKGGFLRTNDPKADRWFSRDITAIAAARALTDIAPYFIDEDSNGIASPRAGLTVIAFPNNHLSYALTWFALALLCAGGAYVTYRDAA